jgi:uncharacterized membrane protein (DUF106 family)
MHVVNLVFGGLVGLVLWPFRALSPWAGMAALSLLTALLMLAVFKLTSDQAAVRKAKDAIKAHLLEMRLYKDNLRVSLGAQGGILKANLRYAAANLRPLLVMIVPLVLILAQMSLWYDRAPLRPGEETLLKVLLDEGSDPAGISIALEPVSNLVIDSPAVRIPDDHEVVWRLRAIESGTGRVLLTAGGRTIEKAVAVGGRPLNRVSSVASRGSFWKRLLHPGEPPLPGGTPIRSIEVLYPAKKLAAFGLGVHWLVAYFVLSLVFGFALKGVFKVEI